MRTEETTEEAIEDIKAFATGLHKTAVVCTDTPGFIVNRLLIPFLLQAISLVQRQEATMEDVDAAMKLGAAHPMGPFELADFIGLDTLLFILRGWTDTAANQITPATQAAIDVLQSMVDQGTLGRKTGQGFFSYPPK